MNKAYILYNLKEVQEELRKTISDLERDAGYDYGNFVAAMSHLYLHLNTAWNARDSSEKEAEECSEANFARWRSMPSADELNLGD